MGYYRIQLSEPRGTQGWLLRLAEELKTPYNYTKLTNTHTPKLFGGPLMSSAYISGNYLKSFERLIILPRE